MRIAASILSADFAHLADEVKHVTDAGIEQIHIEVGDAFFRQILPLARMSLKVCAK